MQRHDELVRHLQHVLGANWRHNMWQQFHMKCALHPEPWAPCPRQHVVAVQMSMLCTRNPELHASGCPCQAEL